MKTILDNMKDITKPLLDLINGKKSNPSLLKNVEMLVPKLCQILAVINRFTICHQH